MDSDDSDITLGPGRLLGLFFMLVAVCGVFFAIGYSLGKTSAREQAINDRTSLSASLAAPAVPESSAAKPSAVVAGRADAQPVSSEDSSAAKSGPDMTFYSAVKKDEHGSQPADPAVASSAGKTPQKAQTVETASVKTAAPPEANAAKPVPEAKADAKAAVAPVAGGAFVVQIAAVSREEDAAALAGALRKKSYSVFVVNNPAIHDKLYHVQVGPFATLQDAEAMRLKLTGEGYNPIVKRT